MSDTGASAMGEDQRSRRLSPGAGTGPDAGGPNPTPPVGESEVPRSAAAKLFDIRLLIGGLFTLYGVMLTISGFFTSDADRRKASDININLWLGLGMLILGLLFLLWHRVNPLQVEPNPTSAAGGGESGRP